nr:DUF3631 domain-containing protein [Rhodococcus sp. 15-649-1-2]
MNYGDTNDDNNVGAELLDEVQDIIRRYCILPSEHALVAVVLWVTFTHCVSAFEYAPRLVVRSPEKRSGKSRLLEVVDALVHRPLRAVNATVSYIFRSLANEQPPTLLFDEADTIFGTKVKADQNEDLRGLLNAGFQRGLTFGRTVGPQHVPTEFETFAPAALAGIGKMPDTIEDRAVVVAMRRRKPTETVQPYRTRRDRPALTLLRDDLAVWAEDQIDALTGAEPDDLGVEDRAADVWEPLIAIADCAGGRWPALARAAAATLVAAAEDDEEVSSTNVRLLVDIRTVFEENGVTFIKSDVLCERLHQIEESPWKQFELTPAKLGHRLKDYGVKTGFKDRTKTERGYQLVDFRDAFERYTTHNPVRTRPHPSDQGEQYGGLWGADASNPSAPSDPSSHNPSSDAMRTGADGLGRVCDCGAALLATNQTGQCAECKLVS